MFCLLLLLSRFPSTLVVCCCVSRRMKSARLAGPTHQSLFFQIHSLLLIHSLHLHSLLLWFQQKRENILGKKSCTTSTATASATPALFDPHVIFLYFYYLIFLLFSFFVPFGPSLGFDSLSAIPAVVVPLKREEKKD